MTTAPGGPRIVVEVTNLGHAILAGRSACDAATAAGFSAQESEQVAVAVSELAGNIVRHGQGGILSLTVTMEAGTACIEITADDRGPGIPDPERALVDGYSTAAGLGLGLGAVNRLMDEIEFGNSPQGGARVICRRRVRPSRSLFPAHRLEFGVMTRARRDDADNGDSFVVKTWNESSLVGVIDGLGHGVEARRAAQQARLYVEEHCSQPLGAIFKGTDRACRATRGVVMALVRFDLGAGTFELASVGNIEARLYGGIAQRNFVVRRGIIGVNAPNPVLTTHAWTDKTLLVLHSDGISRRWSWDGVPLDLLQSVEALAQHLMASFRKDDDDATVVVVRSAHT